MATFPARNPAPTLAGVVSIRECRTPKTERQSAGGSSRANQALWCVAICARQALHGGAPVDADITRAPKVPTVSCADGRRIDPASGTAMLVESKYSAPRADQRGTEATGQVWT